MVTNYSAVAEDCSASACLALKSICFVVISATMSSRPYLNARFPTKIDNSLVTTQSFLRLFCRASTFLIGRSTPTTLVYNNHKSRTFCSTSTSLSPKRLTCSCVSCKPMASFVLPVETSIASCSRRAGISGPCWRLKRRDSKRWAQLQTGL